MTDHANRAGERVHSHRRTVAISPWAPPPSLAMMSPGPSTPRSDLERDHQPVHRRNEAFQSAAGTSPRSPAWWQQPHRRMAPALPCRVRARRRPLPVRRRRATIRRLPVQRPEPHPRARLPPVVQALRETLDRGTALPKQAATSWSSQKLLRDRLPHGDLVRFTGTGTEAAMLAVKVARAHTGRPIVVKAWDGYHGSFDDLEVGLGGRDESPGRVPWPRSATSTTSSASSPSIQARSPA